MADIFETVMANRSAYVRHNRNQIQSEFGLIVRGLDLITRIREGNIDEEKLNALPEEERNAWWSTFAHFRVDSLNSMINALNLILVGCRSDAVALMRNILEAESILEYGLVFNKMKEIRRQYVLGMKEEVKRRDVLGQLDKDGEGRYEAWKSFSEFGSHVLSGRMQMNFCWDTGRSVEQVQGGHRLSRRELIRVTLILIQLLEYAVKNSRAFFERYESFLKDEDFLGHAIDWLSESTMIRGDAEKEFKELR